MFLYVIFKYMIKKKRDETTLENHHEETTERPLYVSTANNEPSRQEELTVVSITSPRQLEYFTEYHPMFMERDEYLS